MEQGMVSRHMYSDCTPLGFIVLQCIYFCNFSLLGAYTLPVCKEYNLKVK